MGGLRAIQLMALAVLVALLPACRKEKYRPSSENETITALGNLRVDGEEPGQVIGMYLLNGGGKGNNEATLDYLDFVTGVYHRNIYAEKNPSAPTSLGDNGTDLAVQDGKLYVVLNNSHKVEVLDARTTSHIASIPVNDCRRIVFKGESGYVSSYLKRGHREGDEPLGEVVRFNVADNTVTGRVTVGCQPEDMLINGHTMYVANSGAYNEPKYDDRLSLIDLGDFTQTGFVRVGPCPFRIVRDEFGYLWVSTRSIPHGPAGQIYRMETLGQTGFYRLYDSLALACFSVATSGNMLYAVHGQWSPSGRPETFRIESVDMSSGRPSLHRIISDNSLEAIQHPTSITPHPTKDYIFITDAKNYTSSGRLYCYSGSGKLRWKVRTGIIPTKIAFVWK